MIAAAWIAGFAALVGLGAVNATTPNLVEVGNGAAPGPVIAAVSPPDSPAPRPIASLSVVERRVPDPDGTGLRRWLEVEGRMLVQASRIRIVLEAREDRIIRTATRTTADPHGGIRPREAARFRVDFEVPSWRSGGMWVTVTAFDERGARLGRLRQRVELYPLPATPEARIALQGRHVDPLAAPFRP